MKPKLNLTINQPCSENFNKFEATKMGGFCNACQKEVIDFTQMSEPEIVAFFKHQTGKTCGRFRKSQLKTYTENNPASRHRKYHLLGVGVFSFSLFSFLSINHSQAQDNNSLATVQLPQKANNQTQNSHFKVSNNEHLVEGIVLYENEPLPGISVYIKGTNMGTVTGLDGKFKLEIPVKTGDVILFQTVGFETQKFVVKENAPKIIYIEMTFKESDMDVMGEVTTNEIYASKPKFWQKLKGLFK